MVLNIKQHNFKIYINPLPCYKDTSLIYDYKNNTCVSKLSKRGRDLKYIIDTCNTVDNSHLFCNHIKNIYKFKQNKIKHIFKLILFVAIIVLIMIVIMILLTKKYNIHKKIASNTVDYLLKNDPNLKDANKVLYVLPGITSYLKSYDTLPFTTRYNPVQILSDISKIVQQSPQFQDLSNSDINTAINTAAHTIPDINTTEPSTLYSAFVSSINNIYKAYNYVHGFPNDT